MTRPNGGFVEKVVTKPQLIQVLCCSNTILDPHGAVYTRTDTVAENSNKHKVRHVSTVSNCCPPIGNSQSLGRTRQEEWNCTSLMDTVWHDNVGYVAVAEYLKGHGEHTRVLMV